MAVFNSSPIRCRGGGYLGKSTSPKRRECSDTTWLTHSRGFWTYVDASLNQNRVYTKTLIVSEQQTKETHMKDGLVGTKRVHVSESSNSDKDHPPESSESTLAMVIVGPNLGDWQQVQKKKGNKGNISDFYTT